MNASRGTHTTHRQRGVALLTVLLLVAVMTLLVMSVLDDIRFGVRRASNAQSMAQAQWYAIGAETLAMAQIRRLDRASADRTTLVGDWNNRPMVFPVDQGVISARMFDATACFNLNSVVEGAPELWQRRQLGAQQYVALLRALGVDSQQSIALTDALVDWIDSDPDRSPLGAEDPTYAGHRPAYRTSGTLLAEVSELRAIDGYSAAIYSRVRPYVCALPEDGLSALNPNTLDEADAPLLVMLTDGMLDAGAARRVIDGRPADGWPDLARFWLSPALAGVELPAEVRTQLSLRSQYFGLHVEVEHAGAQVVLSALFDNSRGEPRLVSRRLTPAD